MVGTDVAKVVMTAAAAKQADALPLPIRLRVIHVVERLADWPDVSGAKPLRGNFAGLFRIRTGDYRVQFHVTGETVTITKVGHRDGFY
jgi:mRNA-degrading endonuclease RelE of RelBE toxin-antitoxin system